MGSRLLNGSPQLSVRVTMLPLIIIALLSTITLGIFAGTPVICISTKHNSSILLPETYVVNKIPSIRWQQVTTGYYHYTCAIGICTITLTINE